jgi:hypothetical protein
MKNTVDLSGWKLESGYDDEQRLVTATIHLQYPELDSFLELKPKKRIKAIDRDQIEKLNKLLSSSHIYDYESIGTVKRPRGLKTTISLKSLKEINWGSVVSGISIHNVSFATKLPEKTEPVEKFYCVKMTVVIYVEGIASKKHDAEERFLLIKANSFDDAYAKAELQKKKYATPYLNPSGRLVKWQIETFDDCYETDIASFKDLESDEGVEIYSKLKKIKSKSVKVWNGKN